MTWNDQFLALQNKCIELYQSGNQDFTTYYTPEDLAFLASIGCQTREFFDFVEDLVDEGQPTASTAVLIAAVRRDYFLVVQDSKESSAVISRDDLPTFGDTLEGISYLPRIIKKAEAKLKGELHPDIMFGCGGDRNFLAKNGNIHPADFLRRVWAADGDHSKIAAFVKASAN